MTSHPDIVIQVIQTSRNCSLIGLETIKLFNGKPGFFDYCAQGSLWNVFSGMIRHYSVAVCGRGREFVYQISPAVLSLKITLPG